MTEPVFDANGWCSDMALAPRQAPEILVKPSRCQAMSARWYSPDDNDENGWWDARSHFWHKDDITHWKPLGPGPVGT